MNLNNILCGENRAINVTMLYANVIALILTSGYVLLSTSYAPLLYLLLLPVLVINLLFFVVNEGAQKNKLSIEKIILIAICLSILIFASLSTLLNSTVDNFMGFLKFSIIAVFSLTLHLQFTGKKLADAFIKTMFVLCILSLVLYAAHNLFGRTFPFPVITNVNGMDYKAGFIYFYFDSFLQFRNTGVFWEPGLFSSFIFISLVLNRLLNSKVGYTKDIVFILTVMTTYSTAGLILIIIYFFMFIKEIFLRSKTSVLMTGAVIGILVIYVNPLAMNTNDRTLIENYSRTFERLFSVDESQEERHNSPYILLDVFSEKPIFGWGLNDGVARYSERSDIALTSTSIFYVVAFGINGLILALSPLFGFFSIRTLSVHKKLFLALSTIFILNKEPHMFFTINMYVTLFLIGVTVSRLLNLNRNQVP